MAIELPELTELVSPLENGEQLQNRLQAMFEYDHKSLAAFSSIMEKLTEPSTQNVVLQSKYRELTSMLKDIHQNHEQYVELVHNHPSCSKERQKAIFAELRDCDEEARLQLVDEGKFPHLIDFLWEFKGWLKNVRGKLDERKKLLDLFDKEKTEAFHIAKTAELQARNHVSLGTIVGTLAGSIVGAALGISTGILPLVTASASLGSYLASSEFKEKEQDNHELKSKLDELSEAARSLPKGIDDIREGMNTHIPRMLFRDLKNSLEIIFKIFEESDRRRLAKTTIASSLESLSVCMYVF